MNANAHGKQVLLDGAHYADAATPEAAEQIAAYLNIADWIDRRADKQRSHGVRLALRVTAQDIRAGLMMEGMTS